MNPFIIKFKVTKDLHFGKLLYRKEKKKAHIPKGKIARVITPKGVITVESHIADIRDDARYHSASVQVHKDTNSPEIYLDQISKVLGYKVHKSELISCKKHPDYWWDYQLKWKTVLL
jgi:hypothetical protein